MELFLMEILLWVFICKKVQESSFWFSAFINNRFIFSFIFKSENSGSSRVQGEHSLR